jgi:hypothetical protein
MTCQKEYKICQKILAKLLRYKLLSVKKSYFWSNIMIMKTICMSRCEKQLFKNKFSLSLRQSSR